MYLRTLFELNTRWFLNYRIILWDYFLVIIKKRSHKLVSNFERLRLYNRLKLRIKVNDYWKEMAQSNKLIFYILFTVHLGTVLTNNQLDALFQCIYFTSVHVSSNPVLIIRRINLSIHHLVCINLCRWLSGMPVPDVVSIHHLVCITLCRWLSGMPVPDVVSTHHLVCITLCRWLSDMPVPDDVLIQLILLMMSTGLLETCREVK